MAWIDNNSGVKAHRKHWVNKSTVGGKGRRDEGGGGRKEWGRREEEGWRREEREGRRE